MAIDHELIAVILPLQLIQEGQFSVTGKNMCASTGKPLRGLSMPKKSVSRLTDMLDMTSIVLTRQ